MANNSTSIRGVKIILEGDASPLISALKKTKTEINQTQKYLNDINKALKLDPKNVELLTQKQKYLKDEIQQSKKRLDTLNDTLDALKAQGLDETSNAFLAVQREIENTKIKIKECNDELAKMAYDQSWEKKVGEAFVNVGNKITALGEKLEPVSKKLQGVLTFDINSYKNFESAFAGVRKTVDATEEEYEMLQQGIRELAQTTASSAEDIAGVMEMAGQLGVPVKDLLTFTKTMVMLGDSTNIVAKEGTINLAKFLNITDTSTDQIDKVGAAIVDLGNNFATQEQDIVDMTYYLGSAGTAAGLTTQEILGLATAMSSAGIKAAAGGSSMMKTLRMLDLGTNEINELDEDIASIGSELNVPEERFKDFSDTIVQYLIGTDKEIEQANINFGEVFGLDDDAKAKLIENLGSVSKNAKTVLAISNKLGISGKQFGQIWSKSPIEALKKFIEVLGNTYDEGDSLYTLMNDLGITEIRQSNMLRALAISYENFDSAVELANKAYNENTALVIEANKRYKTFDSHLSQAKEKLKTLGAEVGERLIPRLDTILKLADKLLEAWDGLDEETKDLVTNITVFGALMSGIAKVGGPTLTFFGKMITGAGKLGIDLSNLQKILDKTQTPLSNFGKITQALGTAAWGPIALGVGALGVALGAVVVNQKLLEKKKLEEYLSAFEKYPVDDYVNDLNEMASAFKKMQDETNGETILADIKIEGLENTYKTLQKITDQNGKIKEGYEEQAETIVKELNEALGLSLEIVDNEVQGYEELGRSIDLIIAKKKAELYLKAYEDDYTQALKNQYKVSNDIFNLQQAVSQHQKDYNELIKKRTALEEENAEKVKRLNELALSGAAEWDAEYASLNQEIYRTSLEINFLNSEIKGHTDKMAELNQQIEEGTEQFDTYNAIIANFSTLSNAAMGEGTQEINDALLKIKYNFKDSTVATKEELEKQADNFKRQYDTMAMMVRNGVKGASQAQLEEIKAMWALAHEEISKQVAAAGVQGEHFVQNFAKGMERGAEDPNNKDKLTRLARDTKAYYHFSVPDKGPLKDADEWGPDFVDLFVDGIKKRSWKLKDEVGALASDIATTMNGSTKFGIAANGANPNSVVNQYSNSLGNVSISIYAQEGQDVNALAERVDEIITDRFIRAERAFAK